MHHIGTWTNDAYCFLLHFLTLLTTFNSTMAPIAPPPALDFTITAEQVTALTKEIIQEELAVNDAIAALKPEEQTVDNVVAKIAHTENTLYGEYHSSFLFLIRIITRFSRQNSTRVVSEPVFARR